MSCDAVEIIADFDRPIDKKNDKGLYPWQLDPED